MKSLQTRPLPLPRPGSIERKTRVGRSQPDADETNTAGV
ncbi:hypothetical protein PASLES2_16295 [Pseudomonas aeruginosa]